MGGRPLPLIISSLKRKCIRSNHAAATLGAIIKSEINQLAFQIGPVRANNWHYLLTLKLPSCRIHVIPRIMFMYGQNLITEY